MFIPDKNNKIKMIQEDIIKSKTYALLNPLIKIPIYNMHKLMSLSSEDAQSIVAIKQIQSIQKYQDIINHQTFKNFIADEDVIRDIKNKDIGKLLINPKMKSLLEDKNLMKDLLQIHKELLRTDLNNSLIDIKFEEDHLPMQN
ncbi:MAG TPA: hypothetical protein PKH98_00755 [Candidatus Omnitrophota bacterium]|nr:hypothetical protein [Candidatus Omnitrophota bacterium]